MYVVRTSNTVYTVHINRNSAQYEGLHVQASTSTLPVHRTVNELFHVEALVNFHTHFSSHNFILKSQIPYYTMCAAVIKECSPRVLGIPFETDEEKFAFIILWLELMRNIRVTELYTIGDNDDDDDLDEDEDQDQDEDEDDQEEDENNEGQGENNNNDDFVVSFDRLREMCRFCKKRTTHFFTMDWNNAYKYWQLKQEIKRAISEMDPNFIFENDMV